MGLHRQPLQRGANGWLFQLEPLVHAQHCLPLEALNVTAISGFGWKIANAVRDDAALIAEWKAQETQAAQDRSLALHWRNGGATRPANVPRSAPTNDEPKGEKSDDELVEKLSELYMFDSGPATLHDEGDETSTQPESSAWAASRPSGSSESDPSILDTSKCVSCLNNPPPPQRRRRPLLARVLPPMPRGTLHTIDNRRVPLPSSLLRRRNPRQPGHPVLPPYQARGRVRGQEGGERDTQPHVLPSAELLGLHPTAVCQRRCGHMRQMLGCDL